jgi:predicted nucleotidyltransferase
MLPLVANRRAEIAQLCRQYHVQRMDVFGSAARVTDFDPARSDIDLLVTFLPGQVSSIAGFFPLEDALAELLGRKVDLVSDKAVENRYVRAGIERSREHLYGS